MKEEQQRGARTAAALFHPFLTLHRCFVSVEMNSHTADETKVVQQELIWDALHKRTLENSAVSRRVFLRATQLQSKPAAMANMEELHFKTCFFGHFPVKCFSDFMQTRGLRTLTMTKSSGEYEGDLVIREALKQNARTTSLSGNPKVLRPDPWQCDVNFVNNLCEILTLPR
ncbi:hypothetical protein HPB50_011303 [Hyalomma asiaticum]|uniref:Uncharacterized protein n=1 Tax=Hyalomma asiaticum TaxID=266040 RepID=A0ACB7RVM2_HYAAI|nr:hypothetical protein HPB50_011303 [Hyalomma asiaticum]